MLDINKYKKMAGKRIDTSYAEQKLIDISRNVDNAYNNTINAFKILSSSDRGTSVTINFTQEYRAVIDYNKDLSKPDLLLNVKEIWIDKGVLHTGDYVSLVNKNGVNETYIVITYVNSEKDYDIAYMQLCNNVTIFKNTLGKIISIPCVLTNKVLYSDGTKVERFGILPDGKVNVVVGKTQDTESITPLQRFIYDHSKSKIFSVSLIDDYSMPGLITITMTQDQYREGADDLVENLASNSITTILINLQATNKELILNDTYQLTPIIIKDNIPFDTALIYESTNTNVATVSPTGLVTSIGLGNSIIKVKLKDNPTIESLITINVIASNQDVYSVGIVGNGSIKKLSSNTYNATVYKNGVAVADNVVWNVMGDTNKIEIVSENVTDITIKALDSVGTIEIYAIRQDHFESAHKTVNLTALW